MPPLYLDYNATTPLDNRVFEAMKPWLLQPSNAGSRTHVYGQQAKEAVDIARGHVAGVLGAAPEDVIFTSGATESNNLAILGLTEYAERTGRRHIVSTTIEHKAVLEPLQELQRRGFEVQLAPVTAGGYVDPEAITRLVRSDTVLVSVMHANNETGVIQPINEIAEMLRRTDVLFHTDAAQTFGKEIEPLRLALADLISISAHKIYGPQGIGALCVRRRGRVRPISAMFFGGGQERGLRPGTMPVSLIVGLGEASRLASCESTQRMTNAATLKQGLVNSLRSVPHQINGDQRRCLATTLNVTFKGIDSEALMMAVRDQYAFSNGSACTSSSYKPSHVLLAMGLTDDDAASAIRLSWGSGVSSIETDGLIRAVSGML